MNMRPLQTAAVLAVTLVAGACGSKPAPAPASPVESAPPAPVTRTDDDAARRAAEEAARRAEEEARRKAGILTQMVWFDYDVATIRTDQRAILDAKLPILREDASIRLRIEGHADDRGSTEYNLALGSRRAEAIRQYLSGFGLDSGRFEIVSYGEERPLVTGRDERSWSQNRRGEFVVSGGQVAAADHGR